MANFPYNTTGFVISSPSASATASVDITSFYTEATTIPPFTSSLLNINGINIQLYRGGTPTPPNTPNTAYVSTTSTLSGTLSRVALAFNVSSSVVLYSSSWSDIVASNNAVTNLNFTSKTKGPQTNNYYLISGSTTIPFTGGKINEISGSFAGFTKISIRAAIISSLIDYNGNELVLSGSIINIDNNSKYDQYFNYIKVAQGSLLLYPISTTIPQI
jgi:hypothetical protein